MEDKKATMQAEYEMLKNMQITDDLFETYEFIMPKVNKVLGRSKKVKNMLDYREN